jgi:pimeloyl-ACP methyl ester carboxylesterase
MPPEGLSLAPPAEPAPPRSEWFDAGGHRIHAVTAGAGPPVVLLHGYGVSGAYMLPLAQALAARSCTAYVPDLPGHGRSPRGGNGLGIRELADALCDWLDAAGLSRPLFVANSMGCQVVTDLAVRRPERVGPLVLIGPTVDPARRGARHQVFGMLRESVREPLSLVGLAVRENAAAGIGPLVRAARACLGDPIERRLPLVEQETVVVHGELDGFVGREWVEHAAALLPRGRLVVVPDECHAVHYTQPELVAEIVCDLAG